MPHWRIASVSKAERSRSDVPRVLGADVAAAQRTRRGSAGSSERRTIHSVTEWIPATAHTSPIYSMHFVTTKVARERGLRCASVQNAVHASLRGKVVARPQRIRCAVATSASRTRRVFAARPLRFENALNPPVWHGSKYFNQVF